MAWLCHMAHGAPGMAAPAPSHTAHPARSPVLFPVLWSRPGALEGGLGSRAVPTGSGSGWRSPGLLFLWDTGALCDLEAVAGACSVPDFQMTLGWELQPRIPGTTRTALTPPTLAPFFDLFAWKKPLQAPAAHLLQTLERQQRQTPPKKGVEGEPGRILAESSFFPACFTQPRRVWCGGDCPLRGSVRGTLGSAVTAAAVLAHGDTPLG